MLAMKKIRMVVIALALGACGGTGSTDGVDATGGADAGTGPDGIIINESRFNTALGRPTDSSIAVSVLAAAAGDKAWVEYATELNEARTDLTGALQTAPLASAAGEPIVVELGGLAPDTRYYYRVHYMAGGQGDVPKTYRDVDLRTNPNKIFTGKERSGETAFSYSIPPQPGDNQAGDFPYPCIGAAPPAGWVYNP